MVNPTNGAASMPQNALPKSSDMYLEDALAVARNCRDEYEGDDGLDVSADSAKRAAIKLAAELEMSAGRLRWAEATMERLDGAGERGTGETLLLGQGSGGPRHFLDGEPVHAGEILLLLTVDGWLGVRYEWSFDVNSEPTAYMALPGAFETTQIPFRIPADARLAWPKKRRR